MLTITYSDVINMDIAWLFHICLLNRYDVIPSYFVFTLLPFYLSLLLLLKATGKRNLRGDYMSPAGMVEGLALSAEMAAQPGIT